MNYLALSLASTLLLISALPAYGQTVSQSRSVTNPWNIFASGENAVGGDLPIGASYCPPGFSFISGSGTCRHIPSGTEVEGWEIVDFGFRCGCGESPGVCSVTHSAGQTCGHALNLTSFATNYAGVASQSHLYTSTNGTSWTYIGLLFDSPGPNPRVWNNLGSYRYVLVARKWPASSYPAPAWKSMYLQYYLCL